MNAAQRSGRRAAWHQRDDWLYLPPPARPVPAWLDRLAHGLCATAIGGGLAMALVAWWSA